MCTVALVRGVEPEEERLSLNRNQSRTVHAPDFAAAWSGRSQNFDDSYRGHVELLGLQIEAWADDQDYEGDSFAIVRSGEQFGFLRFGWGSCSGCDALAGAETDQDHVEILQMLWNGIEWTGGLEELLRFRESADWENKLMSETVGPWLTAFDAALTRLGSVA